MTIQEYIVGRYIAEGLASDPDFVPETAAMNISENEIYALVRSEIFPETIPFYSDSSAELDEFIQQWTDVFYFSEIGAETMGRFRWTLRAWLRTNMTRYRELYSSKIVSVRDLMDQNDYVRHVNDNIRRTGTNTVDLTHGLTVTDTPGETSTHRIIPFGGTSETEISQQQQGGQRTSANTGKDSTVTTPDLTDVHDTWETVNGYQGVNKADVVRAYRYLIFDINTEIFAAMRRDHLFFELW